MASKIFVNLVAQLAVGGRELSSKLSQRGRGQLFNLLTSA